MKCTDCGREIKPVVAFDIDGTLGDYHGHFTEFCAMYFGRRFEHAYDGSCDFEDYLGLTRTEYRAAKLAYRQGGLKRWMPIYHGAVSLVRSTRAAGAEVWIATTRPWQRLDNIDPDTQEWMRRNGLHFDGMLYGDDKYEQLLQSVSKDRIVNVVDDLQEQCREAAGLGLPTIQVARKHNEQAGWPRVRVYGLANIEAIVVGNINQWKDRNGNK